MYKRDKGINTSDLYKNLFREKGREFAEHDTTKLFASLKGLNISTLNHIWKTGDTLLRLSVKYYNNPDDWWVIGIVNGKPTDAHYKLGDVVLIPENPRLIKEQV